MKKSIFSEKPMYQKVAKNVLEGTPKTKTPQTQSFAGFRVVLKLFK